MKKADPYWSRKQESPPREITVGFPRVEVHILPVVSQQTRAGTTTVNPHCWPVLSKREVKAVAAQPHNPTAAIVVVLRRVLTPDCMLRYAANLASRRCVKMMSEIRVQCYEGSRSDERPLRFSIRGRNFDVKKLDGQWYSPDAMYFRIIADDGNYYVLRHDEGQDSWTLDGFRAARQV